MSQKRDIGFTIKPWPKTLDHYIPDQKTSGMTRMEPLLFLIALLCVLSALCGAMSFAFALSCPYLLFTIS